MIKQHYHRYIVAMICMVMIVVALTLWAKTPDLFVYMSHAFCP